MPEMCVVFLVVSSQGVFFDSRFLMISVVLLQLTRCTGEDKGQYKGCDHLISSSCVFSNARMCIQCEGIRNMR
jgi:hypothetical protein